MNTNSSLGWEYSDDSWTRVEHDVPSPLSDDTFINNPWEEGAPEVRNNYKQGGNIDWMHEESSERAYKQRLKSQHGLRGIMLPLLESWRMWLVLIFCGVGIGLIGGWLDVLVAWLSDLRTGRCTYGFFYNQSACCSGLDPSEVCREWATWGEYFGIKTIFVRSILQSIVYLALAVAFATTASFFVQHYAPHAFHTGIPEIKAILGGYVHDAFLGPWTLLIKAIGLALAVASGLSLGKEGPLIHVSCCLASLLLSLVGPVTTAQFPSQKQNESQRRKILAAAATAGVAVAFGSPLGGVLFGLEELDTKLFNDEQLMWRAFVTSAIAATTLAYIDPFGSGKLVLFQVTTSQQWRGFELMPWLVLGVAGGLLGTLLIKLNVHAAVYRRHSVLRDWPILEVALATTVTALVSWPVVFMRDQSSTLVANLFQECEPSRDYHGLCNPASMWENMFLLFITAAIKVVLTSWTFGMKVPAGIFLPTMAIGASLGRSLGIFLQEWHKAHPTAWIFSSCPPEGTCIYPGFYAVIGAAALLGGVTRMTVSLVVILFELTGALSHVLPIMLAVMASKFVGDYFGKGIYDTWIALHGYPYLPPSDYRDGGKTAANVMIPAEKVVTISGRQVSATELDALLNNYDFNGFPVTDEDKVIGYVTRDRLREAIDPLVTETTIDGEPTNSSHSVCTFIRQSRRSEGINLSTILEDAQIHVKKEMPLELVVSMFQRLNLRYVLFTSAGRLTGLLTKRDVVSLVSEDIEESRALSDRKEDSARTDRYEWIRARIW